VGHLLNVHYIFLVSKSLFATKGDVGHEHQSRKRSQTRAQAAWMKAAVLNGNGFDRLFRHPDGQPRPLLVVHRRFRRPYAGDYSDCLPLAGMGEMTVLLMSTIASCSLSCFFWLSARSRKTTKIPAERCVSIGHHFVRWAGIVRQQNTNSLGSLVKTAKPGIHHQSKSDTPTVQTAVLVVLKPFECKSRACSSGFRAVRESSQSI
jgi:hypothetical protein